MKYNIIIIALLMVNINRENEKLHNKMWKMTKERKGKRVHRMQREVFAMKFCYVTFRSVTHAQRGEKLLRSEGTRCALMRTPRWMEVRGCGYALRLRWEDTERAVALLRQKNIPMQKVYIQNEEENPEEWGI